MQNCLCPLLNTLHFFINSLVMQLGKLQKTPLLREVIRQAGNVWTSHPKRLWRVFPEVEAAGGWSWSGFVPEVWAQGSTFYLEPSQRGLGTSSASWPALPDAVFPAPSTFLQEAPLLGQAP